MTTTTYDPSAISISRIGGFVEIVVGKSVVRLTEDEAGKMIRAIEAVLHPPANKKHTTSIH